MERRDLIYEMKKDVKGAAYISMTALAKHLGKGKAYAKEIVADLDTVGNKYFIPDVVTQLMNRRQRTH